jgi:hypothetical protein
MAAPQRSATGPIHLPELPRITIDTAYVPPTGKTIHVPSGGNVQAALDSAELGDMITLEAGATFNGPVTLPRKSGLGWIIVRSATSDANLPPPGTRITPSYANAMPKIVGVGGPALKTAPGAHHFRFIGIEFKPAAGVRPEVLILLGSATGRERDVNELPDHIVFDRVYVHGDPEIGGIHGILLHGRSVAVVDSYFADWKHPSHDTQAIVGWNGPGPFKIVNNHLEAAGENVLLGGADASIPNLTPSDIEISRNVFKKRLAWRPGDPTFAGKSWMVKNLLQLKHAQRVLIEDNLFEDHWAQGQAGFFLVLTPRNQDGSNPWARVADVTFRRNTVRRVTAGVAISGRDTDYPSQVGGRIAIVENLFEEVGRYVVDGAHNGKLFYIANSVADLTIDRNTSMHNHGSFMTFDGAPNMLRLVVTNNVVKAGQYAIVSEKGVGRPTLNYYAPDAVVTRNTFIGPWPTAGGATPDMLPAGNSFRQR